MVNKKATKKAAKATATNLLKDFSKAQITELKNLMIAESIRSEKEQKLAIEKEVKSLFEEFKEALTPTPITITYTINVAPFMELDEAIEFSTNDHYHISDGFPKLPEYKKFEKYSDNLEKMIESKITFKDKESKENVMFLFQMKAYDYYLKNKKLFKTK